MGSLLRERSDDRAAVTSVELFFDLVFVFAVTQLSHRLLVHIDPRGAFETALLLIATWWVWIFTAWATNWLDPDRTRVRLLLFALMAVGLFLSMAIPTAFAGGGLTFALAYVWMHVARSLFVLVALRGADRAGPRRNFARITTWFAVSGIAWIAGGIAHDDLRLACWTIAVAVELAGPALGFVVPGLGRSRAADWDIEGHHLAERCGLFIIIALGESVLATGSTVAAQPWTIMSLSGFAVALVGSIAMWWIYFNIGAHRAADRITHHDTPGLLGRLSYTYLHLPIVAGIIVCAAADEVMLAHADTAAAPATAAILLAGPALFLIGNLLFKRSTHVRLPLSHIVGLALLAALALVATRLTLLALGTATTLLFLLVAVWETLSFRIRHAEPGPDEAEADVEAG